MQFGTWFDVASLQAPWVCKGQHPKDRHLFLHNWVALEVFFFFSLAWFHSDNATTWNETTNNNTKNVKCNIETCQYSFNQPSQQQIQSEIFWQWWSYENQYTWWASHLINYICVHIHLYVLSTEVGDMDEGTSGWHGTLQKRWVYTHHSVLLKWELRWICSDGTGTPERSRHPMEVPEMSPQLEIRTSIIYGHLPLHGK